MRHGEVKQHDGTGGNLERPRTVESARTFTYDSANRMVGFRDKACRLRTKRQRPDYRGCLKDSWPVRDLRRSRSPWVQKGEVHEQQS